MKKLIIFLLTILFLVTVIGCSPSAPRPTETGDPTKTDEPIVSGSDSGQERIMIAAIAAEVGIPFFTTMEYGAKQAAIDYDVDLYWTGPPLWDFNEQIPFIDGAMALNPKAIMIVPTDDTSMITYVETWMGNGIPVISVDSLLTEWVDYVGYNSDRFGGGAEAAKVMYEVNGDGGTYLPVGTTAASFGANERVRGFVETMKELNPTATILDTAYPHHDATKAAELVSAAIIGEPDLRGVFVATSAPASGAASAIIEAGKTGVVKLAAFDADPQQVEDLRDGVYDVLIAQDPYQIGYDAIMNLAKIVRGELTKDDFKVPAVSYPMRALTLDNIDLPENEHFKYIATLPPGY